MIGIIVKLVLALVITMVIIFSFWGYISSGMTTSEAANDALQVDFFQQECLDGGMNEYSCVTPDEDRIINLDDPNSKTRWDGCPTNYPYLINYAGCEPKGEEGLAYCCTKNEPQRCGLQGLRTCYSASQKYDESNPCDIFGLNEHDDFYYDDGCIADCSQGGCEYYDSERGGPGEHCARHPACCGKTDNRVCQLDCPDDYPNIVSINIDDWGCGLIGWNLCCQK